jgi:hypothetical protein
LKFTVLNITIFIFYYSPSVTQQLSYVHYDTKDGLAGSTVYDMCQDKEGFIWFATETGLSRYDGKNFKNYTVSDGLPDNEILRVFADSRGRVWIMPFKKAICYYYRNKIFTAENDSMLKKINPESSVIEICEDEEQNILLGDSKRAIFIGYDNIVKDVYSPNTRSSGLGAFVSVRKNYFEKGFVVRLNDSVFYYKNNSLHFHHKDSIFYDRTVVTFITYDSGNYYLLKVPDGYINYQTENNYVKYINTYNGSFITDTVKKIISEHYLPGKKISRTIKDVENNLWFSTLGEGVYKLPSKEVRTLDFTKKSGINNAEVFSLSKHNNTIVCGLAFSNTVFVNNGQVIKVFNFKKHTLSSKNPHLMNRLFCIKNLSSGITLLGFDSYVVKLENKTTTFKDLYPIKTIEEIDKNFIIAGTSNYAFKLRTKDLQIIDTIWTGRCTKVFYFQKKYYIGTLNGLYEVTESKEKKYLGDMHPTLRGRITDIKEGPNRSLYIATADNGLIIYKDDKIVSTISEKNGLSSNICRTLFLSKDALFIGTNKGLNKLYLSGGDSSIVKYTTSDGLPSDIINAIYVVKDTVWVGSPVGLTYFNEKNISSSSICNLTLLSIDVSGKKRALDSSLSLSYRDNSITFEYAGISLKAGGDIEYYYKLDGLDAKWNKTRETILTYKSLPYRSYKLQLYALNKFGLKSNMINVNFIVNKPFWKRPWLLGIFFCGILLITVWLVNKKYQRILSSREEQNKILRQFAAFEQQALQAQMNPHFIFNCLNSIQQYILTNDKERANQFLTGFASLVRRTLDISEKRIILLSEEIEYLNKYLEMEKMRFGDNFNYEIAIDKSIDPDFVNIPSLLLQPYVENSLRHGIRYKEHGTGWVNISFGVNDNILTCCVKDNGIGRKKAAEYKSKQHIEYQSRGMKLTEKRVDLINKINKSVISIEVIDLMDRENNSLGTEIKLKIPLL